MAGSLELADPAALRGSLCRSRNFGQQPQQITTMRLPKRLTGSKEPTPIKPRR